MHVGCFRLVELEIRTAANPPHGDTQVDQSVSQTLRGPLYYADGDCYVIMRRNLREFVSTWLSRISYAVKIGHCIRSGSSLHLGSPRKLLHFSKPVPPKITTRHSRYICR